MGRILMFLSPSLEALFALWLIRTFGIHGPKGFRNTRVIYLRRGEIEVLHHPEEILVLKPGCLEAESFWRQLEIPLEYKGIIAEFCLAIRSGSWVKEHEDEMRASQRSISQLSMIVFGIFQGTLMERMFDAEDN